LIEIVINFAVYNDVTLVVFHLPRLPSLLYRVAFNSYEDVRQEVVYTLSIPFLSCTSGRCNAM